MPANNELSLSFFGLGKVLTDSRLVVPKYQRPYAWEQDHLKDLLGDLANAIASNAPEYFLGTVVLTNPEDGPPEVIDGQQRLATCIILLAAIRDYLLARNDDRANDIEQDYIAKRDLRSRERVARLTLGVTDHTFFDDTVLAHPGSPSRDRVPERESHHRLRAAAQQAARFVANIGTTNPGNEVARLLDWVEFIKEKARVIVLRVPDVTNAYRVFETLNDRGLDLSVADLLKNHLLSLAGNREDEAHASWIGMAATLEPLTEDDVTIGFIRTYWSSRYGLTREKQLFDRIKERVNSRQAAADLAADLARSAVKYAALVEPSPERWVEYGPTSQAHMGTLNLLRMTQLRPLLLAIVERFSVQEGRAAFRLLVNAAVRIVIVGSRSGSLEEAYSATAAKVHRGQSTTARQIARDLDGLIPQDRDFEDAFAIATVSRGALSRYYLRALERAAAGETHPEWVPNANQEEVSLEHVLPERPQQGWGHFDPETAKTMSKRLGNMALLSVPDNGAVGNRPFADKKQTLRDSDFTLTNSIADVDRWTTSAIEARQRRLAQLALQAWPRTA